MQFLKKVIRAVVLFIITFKEVFQVMKERKGTSFSEYVDTYALDKKTGELVKTGQENRQKVIQSNAVNTYEQLMEAQQRAEVLPASYVVDSNVQINNFYGDFLDLEDYADQLREKYSLPDDMSVQDVFLYLKAAAEKSAGTDQHKEEVEVDNEETVIEEGEQA